ncbi:MAG: hypothetical protein ACSLFO_09055 [Acidimicrobiales bacterium]
MRRLLLALLAVTSLVAAGCGDDDDTADTGAGTTGPADATTDATTGDEDEDAAGDRVETVTDLAGQLDGVADGCALEYEGLTDDQREVSICTLGSDIAELSVWTDETALEGMIADTDGSGDPLVSGPNWSIDVVDPALADEVAEATGGTVHT